MEQQAPRVAPAQIDLLQILIESSLGEKIVLRCEFLGEQRHLRQLRGVSQTSMEHIAREAGVTRGAVYWHFNNKTDLFHAMREQVMLPMIDSMDETLLVKNSDDPLACIERFFCSTILR